MPRSSEVRQPLPALRVRVAGAAWCLEARDVLAVSRADRLESDPDPHGRLGWIPYGGERLPVYSLAERLGAAGAGAPAGDVIVALSGASGRFAVAVDAAERMSVLPAVSRLPLPAAGGPSAFSGAVCLDNEVLLCLSADGLNPSAPPPAADRSAHRPAPAVQAAVSARARGSALLFSLPDLDVMFALSYSQLLELSVPARLWPVSGWPAHVRGLVEWRGRPIPMVDLAICLGRPATPSAAVRRFLIVRPARSFEPLALATGAEVHSRPMPLPHLPWAGPAPFPMSCVRGLFEMGGYPLVVPDLDEISAAAFIPSTQ